MNKAITQILLMILVLLAVMAYVVYNYLHGNNETLYFVVAMGLLGASLLNMLRGLIRALRNR